MFVDSPRLAGSTLRLLSGQHAYAPRIAVAVVQSDTSAAAVGPVGVPEVRILEDGLTTLSLQGPDIGQSLRVNPDTSARPCSADSVISLLRTGEAVGVDTTLIIKGVGNDFHQPSARTADYGVKGGTGPTGRS